MKAIRHLPLALAATLLPALVLIALFWTLDREGAGRAASARARTMSQAVAGELDRQLQLRMREVFALSALPSFRGLATAEPADRAARAAVALREMQALVSADGRLREVFVLDSAGTTTLTTYRGFGVNWAGREFAATALKGGIDVSPPAKDDGELSVFYAAPILNNSGDVAGVLVLRVSAQEIWGPVTAAREECCYAVLTDEYGVRLADAGDPARQFRAWTSLDPALARRLITSGRYGAETTEIPGTALPQVAAALVRPTPPERLDADVLTGQITALQTKPWTILAVATTAPLLSWFWLVAGAGILLALISATALAAWLGSRGTPA